MIRTASTDLHFQPLALLASAFVAVLAMLGGGGTPAPASELACQLLAVCAACAWLWLATRSNTASVRGLVPVLLLVAIVPFAQLVPLPPLIWQALPGREDLIAALALVGREQMWWPVSLAPGRTLDACLALGPPLLAFALAAHLDTGGRRLLIATIAGIGVLSILLGALQLAGGPGGPFLFYGRDEAGSLFGFQANRNAEADVLLIAMMAFGAMWLGGRSGRNSRSALVLAGLVTLVVAVAVVLTRSRTGIVMLPIPLLVLWAMARARRAGPGLSHRMLALSGLIAAGTIVVLTRSPPIARVLARFDFSGEYRVDIWQDTLFAIGRTWPVGSGFGTFTLALFPAERLEVVSRTFPNRAHNEILELALEGGIFALGCWGAAAALVFVILVRSLRHVHGTARDQLLFAGGSLLVTGLHAMVDYPFRSMALAGLIGAAAGMILGIGQDHLPGLTRRLDDSE